VDYEEASMDDKGSDDEDVSVESVKQVFDYALQLRKRHR
jgi:hypothetical protein